MRLHFYFIFNHGDGRRKYDIATHSSRFPSSYCISCSTHPCPVPFLQQYVFSDAVDGGDGQPDIDGMSDVNSLMTSLSMYTENTHTGQTLASGTASGSWRGGIASTQGGRRAQARGKKGKAKGGKIRQGELGVDRCGRDHGTGDL